MKNIENKLITPIINENMLLIDFKNFKPRQLSELDSKEIIELDKVAYSTNKYIFKIKEKNLIHLISITKNFNDPRLIESLMEFQNYYQENNERMMTEYELSAKIKNNLLSDNFLLNNNDDYLKFQTNIKNKLRKIIFNEENNKNTEKQMHNVFQSTRLKYSANFSEPGSGKTLMTLMTHFERERQSKKKLKMILVTPIVAFNVWKEEILKFTNIESKDICILHNNYKDNKIIYPNYKVIMINYEGLKRHIKNDKMGSDLLSKDTHLIIDEVHRAKNIESQTSSNIKIYIREKNVEYITILTGTPWSNDLGEFINILNINWKNNIPILSDDLINEVNGILIKFKKTLNINDMNEYESEKLNEFLDIIYPFYILLNKKEDFNIADPIDNFFDPIYVSATDEQKKEDLILNEQFNKLKFQLINKSNYKIEENNNKAIFGVLTKMRKNSSGLWEPKNKEKIEKLFELVSEIINKKEKVIIWFEFKNSMNYIKKYLNEKNINSEIINEEISFEEREKIFKNFKTLNDFKVLLATPSTMGESVSFHNVVKYAIFVELNFSYYKLIQAKNRIHRVGIEDGSKVTYFYIDTKDLAATEIIRNNLIYKDETRKLIFKKGKRNSFSFNNILNSDDKLIIISNKKNEEDFYIKE